MPEKPPAPNPPPPKDCDGNGIINVERTRLAMFRWGYPLHHACGHYRGFKSAQPTICFGCANNAKRQRKFIVAHVVLLVLQVVLGGCMIAETCR